MRRCVVWALWLAGCGNSAASTDGGADMSASEVDMAVADFTVAVSEDLAIPDLAMRDIAMPDLALPDLAMPDLAMPDLATPPDLRPRVDMAYTCMTSSTAASAAAAGSGPSVAYVAPYWGVTWANGSGATIMYNSVNLSASTPLQNASDVTIIAAQSGFTYEGPRIVAAGTQFAVGWGYSVTMAVRQCPPQGPAWRSCHRKPAHP